MKMGVKPWIEMKKSKIHTERRPLLLYVYNNSYIYIYIYMFKSIHVRLQKNSAIYIILANILFLESVLIIRINVTIAMFIMRNA
jgi:hypothetical protein